MLARGIGLGLVVALCAPVCGYAQGSYVSVAPGISAGDGGAAPSVSVSAGYVTPRRVGFEVEFSYTDRLDLRDDRFPRIQSSPMPRSFDPLGFQDVTALGLMSILIFPPIDLNTSGRLVSFHTNAVGEIATTRRFRAMVSAGGGVAALRQRTHLRFGPLNLPLPLGAPMIDIQPYESVVTTSDTGLSLGAGMTLEYRVTRSVGLGGDVRYQHVFLDPGDFDHARVGARLTWRF